MVTAILLILSLAGNGYAGYKLLPKVLNRFRKLPETDEEWSERPVLETHEWEIFRNYIANECKGYWLAREAVQALFRAGYRFSAGQIYELAKWDKFSMDEATLKDYLGYRRILKHETDNLMTKIFLAEEPPKQLNA